MGVRYKKRPWLSFDGKVIWRHLMEADTCAQHFLEYKGKIRQCSHSVEEWVVQANSIALIIFTIKVVLLLYGDRHTYFLSRWNTMDSLIVLVGRLVEYVLLFLARRLDPELDPHDSGSVSYHELVDSICNLEKHIEMVTQTESLVFTETTLDHLLAEPSLLAVADCKKRLLQHGATPLPVLSADTTEAHLTVEMVRLRCKKRLPQHGATFLPVLSADSTEADFTAEMVRLRHRIADHSAEREGTREEVVRSRIFFCTAELLASAATVLVRSEMCNCVGEVV